MTTVKDLIARIGAPIEGVVSTGLGSLFGPRNDDPLEDERQRRILEWWGRGAECFGRAMLLAASAIYSDKTGVPIAYVVDAIDTITRTAERDRFKSDFVRHLGMTKGSR